MPRLFPPASFFSIPLGLVGLGFAWRTAARLWHLPTAIAESIMAASTLIWAVLILLYALKWIFARHHAITEIVHPVLCCFVGLAPVTTNLVAVAALPYSWPVALVLFVVGVAGTILFAVFRTGKLWMGGGDMSGTTAILYLPTVAGFFTAATAAAEMGWKDWGQLAFGAGFFSWLAIESVIANRLVNGPPMPVPLRPTLGIQLAPPAVGALAYLHVSDGATDIVARALLGYALLQAMLLIRLLGWIREQAFTTSYWGFSFGAAALAAVIVRLAANGGRVEVVLAPPLFVIANLVFVVLVIGTVRLIVAGKLLPPA